MDLEADSALSSKEKHSVRSQAELLLPGPDKPDAGSMLKQPGGDSDGNLRISYP
jgi:hypothetical protein